MTLGEIKKFVFLLWFRVSLRVGILAIAEVFYTDLVSLENWKLLVDLRPQQDFFEQS